MTSSTSENPLSLSLAAWMLAVIGWGGLAGLVLNVDPRSPLPVWAFFLLWLMAITGTAVPFVRYLNRRFAREAAPEAVLLRQSLWVGFFGAACAWLELSNLLSPATAVLLVAGLAGVEWFLRLRERARWAPDSDDDEPA